MLTNVVIIHPSKKVNAKLYKLFVIPIFCIPPMIFYSNACLISRCLIIVLIDNFLPFLHSYNKKTFSNEKTAVITPNVFDVAEAIKGILEASTRDYFVNESSSLINSKASH